VLYEALCGVNPARGSTPAETARLLGRPIPPLGPRRRDLPAALASAIDRALARREFARGTIDDLRGALEDALASGLPALAVPSAADSGVPAAFAAPTSTEYPPDRNGAPVWVTPRRRPRVPRGDAPARGLGGMPTLAVTTRAALDAPAREHPDGHAPAGTPDRAYRTGRQARHDAPAEVRARPRRSPPRAVWAGAAGALVAWQAWGGRPGAALLLLAALVALLLLPLWLRPQLLLCGLAPVLGLAGLAGVFPALAGQASAWRTRAALGALGYWWLTLAEPLAGRRLWLGPPSSMPSRTVWEGSLGSAATHVVGPTLSAGVLFGAALWACGAVILPWIVRGTRAAFDIVAATMWSAALVSAAPVVGSGIAAHAATPSPRGAVAGAVLGAVVAVGARALRGHT